MLSFTIHSALAKSNDDPVKDRSASAAFHVTIRAASTINVNRTSIINRRYHIEIHASMARVCVSRACLWQDTNFTDDTFRKGPRPPLSDQFWDTCNSCRGSSPVPLLRCVDRNCKEELAEIDLMTGSMNPYTRLT